MERDCWFVPKTRSLSITIDLVVSGDPIFIPRVLEVVKGQLCYVIGTVYMEMPLKPNVLDDIARDHSIPAPAPPKSYHSEKDNTMLEDESGRIRLVGERLKAAKLVTGVIIGALGIETNNGDFEVVDVCFAGMPPQNNATEAESSTAEESMDVDDPPSFGASDQDEWIGLISGLEVGSESASDAQLQMLTEYLTGEACGPDDQQGSSRISCLIIAGNSLAPVVITEDLDKKPRRYGHDTTSFSPHPTHTLASCLEDISRSIPIHLLAGATDPSGTILPQQPLPRAMFGGSAAFSSFSTETNPTYLHIGTTQPPSAEGTTNGKASSSKASSLSSQTPNRTLLIHSGQPLDDMMRYLPSPPATRLGLAESTLRWRHIAPTAPDTLWCYPYFTNDPFVINETPDIYVVGNQPAFKTKMVRERGRDGEAEKRCRVVLVPGFRETGTLVLVNLRSLAVRTVCFAVEGMTSGSKEG
ncbi:hypothetical protein EIP86_002251 [Pleurotus ostreatoroseus]|nr:hypothetical protein EIP86_002251 [Pleurotus ostreatoroseus]